jgi:hypothetical protein
LVAGLLPGGDFLLQGGFVGDTPIQALAVEHTQFDFGDVQPRAMWRGEVEAQAVHEAICLDFAKVFDQGMIVMGVEVIQHDTDLFSFWKMKYN